MRHALLLLAFATFVLTACGGQAKPVGPAVPDVRGENFPDAVVDVLHARLCPRLKVGKPEAFGARTWPVVAVTPTPGTHVRKWTTVTITARIPGPRGHTVGKSHTSVNVFSVGPKVKTPCGPITP